MTDDRSMPCSRAHGLIGRVVDERVTPDDRAHATTCATCGPILMRAARFDDELRRTARGFVAEELPRGILDQRISSPVVSGSATRSATPGLAGILSAVAILIVATAVAVLPGSLGPSEAPTNPATGAPPATAGPPVATPAPTGLAMTVPALVGTSVVGGKLIGSDWTCDGGDSLAGNGSVDHEGIVCTSPKSYLLSSVVAITGETVDNEVIEVAIKGQLVVVETENARAELAEQMSKAAFLSVTDEAIAGTVGEYVLDRVPQLKVQPSGDQQVAILGNVRLTLQRSADGSYFLLLQARI